MMLDFSWLPTVVSPWSFYLVGAMSQWLAFATILYVPVPQRLCNHYNRRWPRYGSYVAGALMGLTIFALGLTWAIIILLMWMGVQL